MSDTTPVLTYFNIRGRGELLRLTLRAAGVTFEDRRVEMQDWPALQPNTPHGSLPFIEVEGRTFGQSSAIATYLAKEYGFYGSNNMERLFIDEMLGLRNDLLTEEIKVMFESKDDQERAAGLTKLRDEVYPRFLAYFAKSVYKNQERNNTNHAVGNKLSLADLIIHEGTQSAFQSTTCVHAYPEVKKVREAVEQYPTLKAYLAERPSYPL